MRFVSSTYDQENRLTKWEKGTKRSEWNYNGLGLQRELREYENGSLIKTERYVYDGTQIVAILNAANTTVKTFTRGLDLSGSMEGAGGIGGLLGMKDGTNTAYYFADGNGNVAALYGEQGESRAVYQYDGFGNKVVSSGSMSESNPFQWSSKYFHQPSGLVAYEFRFYSSTLGRWLNRDPIGEAGGINLYGFVVNDPLNRFDPFGLSYFAYRPLDSTVGKLIGVTGTKLDDNLNTMAAHEQLFFEDSKSPENLGFFDDNQVRPDKSSLKYKAGHDTGWNDCVMRKAVANVKPSSYCLLGKPGKTEKYNCQDWADAVRAEYRRLMKDTKIIAACCPTDGEKKK